MHCACGLVAVNDLVHRARADVLQLRPRRAPRRYGYTAGAALIIECGLLDTGPVAPGLIC